MNTSPEVIEYLATQYTGFLGAMAIPALSIEQDGSLGGVDAMLSAAARKWTADPSSSNDVTKEFYNMKSILSTITSEASAERPQGLLLRSLSQDEVDTAYESAKEMLSNGGIVYEANKLINDTYKEIDKINANESLTDDQKYTLTREAKLKMLRQVEAANEAVRSYYKKYIQGETLVDRVFGSIRKGFEEGKTVHIKNDVEKLPETFAGDMDSEYMQRALSVWNGDAEGSESYGYHKEAALPHPSQTFTLNTRNNGEEEYTIPDDEWPMYMDIYKAEYNRYVMLSDKGRRWDTLNDKERYDLLKAAAASANKKMKESYARNNGIKLK